MSRDDSKTRDESKSNGSKTSFTIVLSKSLLQSSHVFAVCVDSMQDNLWFLMCSVALHVFANCIQMYGKKAGMSD